MKKKIAIGIVIAIIIVGFIAVLIGVFVMNKKIVKQDNFDLQGINVITFSAKDADVNIIMTDDSKMTIVQYSKKNVEGKEFGFTASIDGSQLTIVDNGKEVNWLFGIKGNAGISYEIKMPKTYAQNICIKLGSGNIDYNGADNCKIKALDINVADHGNVKLSMFDFLENSNIFTARGNVDINFTPKADCLANCEALSGNVAIAERYKSGKYTLTIKSNQGNITVK